MPSLVHQIDIAATPERVWEVLGDIASVDRWIPGVTEVRVDGQIRICHFEDGHTQHEQILDYSPEHHSYRYVIEGAPLPISDNTGTFSIQPTEGGSRVVWESSFQALDPAHEDHLATMWEPYLPIVLNNLKQLVEAG